MSAKIVRAVGADDPYRCQGTSKYGQCLNRIVQDAAGNYLGQKCMMHGGSFALRKSKQEAQFQYRLGQYQNRFKDFATNPGIVSLREEIAVLRVMLEERMCKMTDDFSFVTHAGPVADLTSRIERLVRTCATLEEKSGVTLTKQQVEEIGDKIFDIMVTRVGDLDLDEDRLSSLLSSLSEDLGSLFVIETLQKTAQNGTQPAGKLPGPEAATAALEAELN